MPSLVVAGNGQGRPPFMARCMHVHLGAAKEVIDCRTPDSQMPDSYHQGRLACRIAAIQNVLGILSACEQVVEKVPTTLAADGNCFVDDAGEVGAVVGGDHALGLGLALVCALGWESSADISH